MDNACYYVEKGWALSGEIPYGDNVRSYIYLKNTYNGGSDTI